MPEGTWELVTHPGYNDTDLAQVRTRLRASREIERQALLALENFPGIERISFVAASSAPSVQKNRKEFMRIGITCYPTYGGSGVVATELGIELAARGHEVHFISYSQPFQAERTR